MSAPYEQKRHNIWLELLQSGGIRPRELHHHRCRGRRAVRLALGAEELRRPRFRRRAVVRALGKLQHLPRKALHRCDLCKRRMHRLQPAGGNVLDINSCQANFLDAAARNF